MHGGDLLLGTQTRGSFKYVDRPFFDLVGRFANQLSCLTLLRNAVWTSIGFRAE